MTQYKTSALSRDLPQRGHRLLSRLFREDSGQDVIEYALLTGAIGIVALVVWQNITGGLDAAYLGWDTGVQNLWEPDDPVVGP